MYRKKTGKKDLDRLSFLSKKNLPKTGLFLFLILFLTLLFFSLIKPPSPTTFAVIDEKDTTPPVAFQATLPFNSPLTIESGKELRYHDHQFSNLSGIVTSTNPHIYCDWGRPADPYKSCTAFFSIENQNSDKPVIHNPIIKTFFENSTAKDVTYLFSDDYERINFTSVNFSSDSNGEQINSTFTYEVLSFNNWKSLPNAINTRNPFGIRVEYKDLKYNSNQFNLTVSSSGFLAKIDPTQSACGTLGWNDGEAYNLTQDVTATEACFTIANKSVILDCLGAYKITYGTAGDQVVFGFNDTGFANVTLRNCNFLEGNTSTSGKHAVQFTTNADNSTIFNNTMKTLTTAAFGIAATNSRNINSSRNNISTPGANAHTIRYTNVDNGAVIENSVNATGTNAIGLQFITNSDNNTIRDNKVRSISTNGGVAVQFLTTSVGNLLEQNLLTGGTVGVSFGSPTNKTVILNNNITATAGGSLEISDNNNLNAVNNYLIYNNSFGEFRWTQLNYLTAMDTNTTGKLGVNFNLYLYNNTLTFNTSSFTLAIAVTSNITSSNANLSMFGLNFTNVTNILRVEYPDVDYGNITQSSLAYDCTKNNLGCQIISYNQTTGNLIFNVTNVTGAFVANGTYPSIVTPAPVFILNTEANGTAANQNFILFNITIIGAGTVTSYDFTVGNSTTVNTTTYSITNTTATFNFSILGLGNDTYQYNVTATGPGGTNTTENRYILIDNKIPQPLFIANTEANGTYKNQNFILLNTSIVNEQNVANVTITISNSTTVNTTTFVTTNTTFTYNFSILGLGNDTYLYNITVRDKANNVNTSETRVLFIDTKTPQPLFIANTEANGTYKNQNFILFNVSVLNEKNIANITFTLSNSSTVNSTTYSTVNTTLTFNFTDGFNNDTYLYNVTVTDKANNQNTSETRVIYLDPYLPVLTFILNTEANGTVRNQSFILINISITNEQNLANLTFTLANSSTVNTTSFTTTNTTFTFNFSVLGLGNDTFLYNVTARDKANNVNISENRVLIIDNQIPQPLFVANTEANGTYKSQNFILFNASILNEQNVANITFSVSNSTTVNTTTFVTTNTTFTFNFSVLGLGNDTYLYNFTVRDKANTVNTSETRVIYLDTLLPVLTFVPNTESNGTYKNQNFVLLNFTITNEQNLANISLSISNSTTVNTTIYLNPNLTFTYNFSVLGLGNDTYLYNITATDKANNINVSETRVLFIDNKIPQPLLISTTEQNGTYKSQNFILINTTILNEQNIANITFTISNSTTVNTTTFSTSNLTLTYNFTGTLGNDTYLYNVTVTDKANNQNISETRVIYLDQVFPRISLIANTESNGTYKNQNFIFVNASLTNEVNFANITFSFSNSTLINQTTYFFLNDTYSFNFTTTSKNDTYLYNVTVTDKANNVNVTQLRVIFIDSITPSPYLVLNTEANGTYKSQNFILINTSILNEQNVANLTFTISNSTTVNTTTLTTANTTFTFNFTGTLGNDTYVYNFSVTDKANNINISETRVLILDQLLPVITFVPTTQDNGSYRNQNFVLFNFTITNEQNLANVTLTITNSSTVNATTYVTSNLTFTYNFTSSFNNDTYLYNVTVTDKANNINTSETRVLILNKPGIIGNCINITQSGAYNLSNSLSSPNTCIVISNRSINLDCLGYNLTYSLVGDQVAYGVDGTYGFKNITIRNCKVYEGNTSGSTAITFDSSDNTTVYNNTVQLISTGIGIFFTSGRRDNVTQNAVTTNESNGVGIRFSGQQDSFINENNVTTAGTNSFGINIISTSINTTVRANKIRTFFANNAFALYLQASGSQVSTRNTYVDSNVIIALSHTVFISGNTNTTTLVNNNLTASRIGNEIIDTSGPGYYNYLIYNNSFGEIKWTSDTFTQGISTKALGGMGLGMNIFIGNNTIAFNSSAFNETNITNSTTQITLFGLNLTQIRKIYKVEYFDTDYGNITQSPLVSNCRSTAACVYLSYISHNLIFNSTNFSSFTATGTSGQVPSVSNLAVVPPTPVPFHPANRYTFSATISDPDKDLSEVIFSIDNINYSKKAGEIINFTTDQHKIVVNGLGPGDHSYFWFANDTTGNENYSIAQNLTVLQTSRSNPLSLTISPTQVTLNDTVLISVQTFLDGKTDYTNRNITNTTLFVYNFSSGSASLIFNTSNFTYLADGKWYFLYNTTNRGAGLHRAVVDFTTNETIPQTFEQSATFAVSTVPSSGGLSVSGALFLPNDTLIVDAIFTNTQGSNIAGAQCNLTLLDQNKSIVLSRANMPENTFTDISHYTYINTNFINTTNTTTTGNYYGHIQCTSGTLTRVSSLSFAILDLPNRIKNVLNISNNTLVTNQIIAINTSLVALINKDFSFDQEQIFLITDSLNQINSLATQVAQGTLSPEQAQEQLQKIKQNLLDHLQQQKTQTVHSRGFFETFSSNFTRASQFVLSFKKFILGILAGIILFLLYTFFVRKN